MLWTSLCSRLHLPISERALQLSYALLSRHDHRATPAQSIYTPFPLGSQSWCMNVCKISQSRLSINSAPWCQIHARTPPQLLAWSQSFLFSCSQPEWLSRTSVQTTQSQAIQSASQKHDCWHGGIAPCTPSLLHPARWKCPVEAGVEWGVSYSPEVSCQVQKGNSSFFWRKALDSDQKLFKTTHWCERALKQQIVCSCCFLHLLSS